MIFLDNASTTKVYEKSLEVYNTASLNDFYNPGALYNLGSKNYKSINESKINFLKYLGATSNDKIIFTSGATESNNMAIMGSIKNKNAKLLFSLGEHPAVYNVAKNLESLGYNVEYIKLIENGEIDYDDFVNKIDDKVAFVSIMHVNNETGAVNDIEKLVKYAKSINPKIIFHSDGVQAFGKIDVNVNRLGVDLYTISGHKIHAPRGIGALFCKNGINLKPIIFGGGQENGLRSGTENYPAIKAFDKSAEIILKNRMENFNHVKKLSELFKQELLALVPNVVFNGENKSPYIVSFSLPGSRAETLLHMLDDKGVLLSNGSACSTKKLGNRILQAMGVSNSLIEGSLRVSFSEENSIDEIKIATQEIANCYNEYISKVKN